MVRLLTFGFIVLVSISVGAQQDGSTWRLEDHVDPLATSIVGKYTDSETLKRMVLRPNLRGEAITIDTQNKEVCEYAKTMLDQNTDIPDETLRGLCGPSRHRYVSILRMEPQPIIRKSAFDFEMMPEKTIGDQLEVFSLIGAGMMGVIATLPSDVTNWDDNALKNPLQKWKTNVSNPPVIDGDSWAINYLGHPYAGAAYYVVARQTGFGRAASFGFAVLMSTFYWEYGFEAFAEKPSIQDLILTPTIGSLIGEPMYRANEHIQQNNGTYMGSKRLGTVGLIVTDPVGALVDGLNQMGNNNWVHDGKVSWASFPVYDYRGFRIDLGVGFQLKLNFGKP